MRLHVDPGKTINYPNPLNLGDKVSISIDWSAWLGSDTISSAAWTADSDLTVSGETTSTPTTTALIAASGTVAGNFDAECQITTAAGQLRTVAVRFEVVNLV